jgi:hypothetical protein
VRPGRDAEHSPHEVLRSRMSRSNISSHHLTLYGVAGQLYFLTVTSNHNIDKRNSFFITFLLQYVNKKCDGKKLKSGNNTASKRRVYKLLQSRTA